MKKTNFIDGMSAQEQIHARRVGYGYGALAFLLLFIVGVMQVRQLMQWRQAKKEWQTMQHHVATLEQGLNTERELQQTYQDMHNKILHINSLKKSTYNPSSFISLIAKAVAADKIKKIMLHCNECELIVQAPDINYALHVVQKLSGEQEFKHMQIYSMQQDTGNSMLVVLRNTQV